MVTNQLQPGLRIVGLSGGIGAGKSTVAKYLLEYLPKSTLLINADAEVGQLLASEEVATNLSKVLGDSILRPDGLIDRRQVAALIFKDEQARKAMENVIHPAVRAAIFNKLVVLENSGEAVWAILDVPLLFEGGLDKACDFILFVEVGDQERCRRACERHDWETDEWMVREKAQLELEHKQSRADAMVRNEGSLDTLDEQLAPISEQILALAPRPLRDSWPA